MRGVQQASTASAVRDSIVGSSECDVAVLRGTKSLVDLRFWRKTIDGGCWIASGRRPEKAVQLREVKEGRQSPLLPIANVMEVGEGGNSDRIRGQPFIFTWAVVGRSNLKLQRLSGNISAFHND